MEDQQQFTEGMPLAETPDGGSGGRGATPTPSPSAATGDGEEAPKAQRRADDRGVQSLGVKESVSVASAF